MTSLEHKGLVHEVGRLEGDLLNFGSGRPTLYSYSEILRRRSFFVFSHAELEWYWERTAESILNTAEMRWKKTGEKNSVLNSLMGQRRKARRKPTHGNAARGAASRRARGGLEGAIDGHRDVIERNNGIRRDNIKRMFDPLGVLMDDFDQRIFTEMGKLSTYRGDIVHRSFHAVPVYGDADPASSGVSWLVSAIGKIDERLHEMGLLSDPAATQE